MFACLMRVRRWRGWMRGSRTTSDLRPAETFSAHLTERRHGGILKLRCRTVCSLLWRSMISMSSTTGRSLRAVTTGRRTMTHRSFSADLLTGESSPSERWSAPATTTTDWVPRKGMKGSQVASKTETVRGRGVQDLQVPAQARVGVKGRIPTKKMMTRRAARRVEPRRRERAGRRTARSTSEKQCKSEETCCWWNTVAFLVI